MTLTTYCFQNALCLNYGSIFFSSFHFLNNTVYIIMRNMLTCLVAHGF